MSDDRPNILFAFADDWGRYASCYAGHEGPDSINHLLDTPHVDRVANEGALFTNAFVNAPSCTPCRSSILAGQYFWQTGLGAILIGAVWDESIPTYPLELEKAGYHIGHTYKVWAPGKARNAPYGADRTAYNDAGVRFGQFSHEVTRRVTEDDLSVDDAKRELLDETRDNFRAFLEDRKPDTPFAYWWGPTNTHRTWEPASGEALWGLDPDRLEGRLPGFLPDVPEVREDVNDYLGECQAVDAGLGVLLAELERIGELDHTIVVVSGDHGIPGFPRAKCNLYDIGCEVPLVVRWPGRVTPGRVIEDFLTLHDLAPTFLEAAGVDVPNTMTGRSLLPILTSDESGRIEPDRDFVVTGRERHVHHAREGNLPYPQRAIRTDDHLYIINFAPDRWPMGDPAGLDDPGAKPPPFEKLQWDTFVAYGDLDASPTKAWMIYHRGEKEWETVYDLGFGKRPREELYDLRKDPDYMQNVAGEPAYGSVRADLEGRLMDLLRDQDDPRVAEDPCRFEQSPYAGELEAWQK